MVSPQPPHAEQCASADQTKPYLAHDLLQLVYSDLRKVAAALLKAERPEHTLQATALVHEAYLRMAAEPTREWDNHEHFFRTAARLMRNILVDHARRRRQERRGGHSVRHPLDETIEALEERSGDLLVLDESLDRLAMLDSRQGLVVELRFFAGMSMPEIAKALSVSLRTIESDWALARAWLFREMKP